MRILLTGSSRGIGRAIAERLAQPGAALALCASRPSPELDEVVADSREAGAEAVALSGDMGARAAFPHLAHSRGSFLAVASMSGIEPYPGTGACSASKAALIMMTRTLALEWASSGVRANSVSPGLFLSAMTAPIYADPAKKAEREALVPMRRIGDPARDFAGLVEFMISSDAGHVTGQNVLADGGLLGSIQGQIAGRPQSGNA